MREVVVAPKVKVQLGDLVDYLHFTAKMSEYGVMKYRARVVDFLNSLGNDADYSLCRFERWRELGYRCAVFERGWIFAYEVSPKRVIVRDMSRASAMKD